MYTDRWCIRGVQAEVSEVVKEMVESLGHVLLGEDLAVEVGEEAGRHLPAHGLPVQRQRDGDVRHAVLLRHDIHLQQRFLKQTTPTIIVVYFPASSPVQRAHGLPVQRQRDRNVRHAVLLHHDIHLQQRFLKQTTPTIMTGLVLT